MNRSDLQQTVRDYSHRTDVTDALFATFLELAESRIAAKCRATELVTVAVIDTSLAETFDNAWPLPADFVEMRDVQAPGRGGSQVISLMGVGRDQIKTASHSGGGTPAFYSIYNGVIEIRPGPQGAQITIIYYSRPTPLVDDADETELLTNYPGIYLYGVLTEVWAWSIEPEDRTDSLAAFMGEMQAINDQAWNARAGTAMQNFGSNNYNGRGASRWV